MKPLSLLMLGPPQVRWHGEVVPIQRRTPRALLFYLAARAQWVARQEVISLFWGDNDDATARLRLRETLNKLRSSLPSGDVVLAENDLVGLDFDAVDVDLITFQKRQEELGALPWKIPSHEPLPPNLSQPLIDAARLWRSASFLDGIELPDNAALEHWLVNQSEQLGHQRGRLLERLADHYAASGDTEMALQTAQAALSHDELDEGLHARVLRLLLDIGRRQEALEHYRRLDHLLQEELGMRPGAQIEALYRQMTGGAAHPATQAAPRRWNVHSSVQTRFIGRSDAITELQLAFRRCGAVFITGESGIGKTRLMEEFTNRLQPPYRLLIARCRPAETSLPFQPLIDMLRNDVGEDEWRDFPPPHASELAALLPELAIKRSELTIYRGADPEQGRARAMEALRQAMLYFARHERLLLIIDDAQWADEATLATFAYLIERPPFDRQALAVAAARSEERNQSLENILDAICEKSRIRTIRLERFTLREVSELTRAVIGGNPTPRLVERLTRESGGNPLFILETLRSLLHTSSQVDVADDIVLPLAASLHAMIRKRLAALSPDASAVLEVAALVGTEFIPVVIQLALGMTPGRLTQALEQLEHLGLVELALFSPHDLRYRFVHDKFREALLLELHPMREQWLHAQIARAFTEITDGQSVSAYSVILAQHYEAAHDWEQAFVHWIHAGQYAEQLFSMADAQQAYARAQSLVEALGMRLADEPILHLYDLRSELAFIANETAALRQISHALQQLGEQRNSPLLIGAALIGYSKASMTVNQFDDGLEFANQALLYLQHSPHLAKRMEASITRSGSLYRLNRWDEAIASLNAGLELGKDNHGAKVSRARAAIHYQLAMIRTLQGWPSQARDHALRSFNECLLLDHSHSQQAAALGALALAQYFMGEIHQARADARRGIDLAERIQSWRNLGQLHGYRATIELAMGNVDDALYHADQAIEIGERYQYAECVAVGLRTFGDALVYLKTPVDAGPFYRDALLFSQEQFFATEYQVRLGSTLFLAGRVEEANQLIAAAIEQSEKVGMGLVYGISHMAILITLVAEGKWQQAKEMIAQFQADAVLRSIPLYRIYSAILARPIYSSEGQNQQIIAMLKPIAQEAAVMGFSWLEIDALAGLVSSLRSTGEPFADARQRIVARLGEIEKKCQREPYREIFTRYREKILPI